MRRAATPALIAALTVALVVAALSVGVSIARFTDSDPVPGNSFSTCAQFPPEAAVARVGSWTTGLTHTAGAGTHRLLLFVVGYENGADPGVSTVTYGGQPLTRITGAVAGTSTYARSELWYLKEAGIAAASGTTFSVTWGGSTPSQPMYAAATFANVNQGTPIGASSSAFTDSSTPNPITTAVSVLNGSMAVSGAVSGNSGSYTWNNGWTEGTDQTSGSTTTMSSAEHGATAAGTDTASATHSNPNRQAIVAAALNPPPTAVARVGSWTTGLSHTAAAGSDRLLLFVVGYESGADPGVSSVSYGGQALTRITGAVAGTSTYARSELWYLNEADIAAAAGNTFSVTWGGSTPSQPMYAAATFEGVNQCKPIGDSASASTNSSTPNPITATVNVSNGSMAVSGAVSGNSGSYTWGNGWTEGTDQTAGSTTTMSSAEHGATAAGTDTASATHSGPNRQAIVAAALNHARPSLPPPVAILDPWTTGTTHSVSAGSNRLLLVGVYAEHSGLVSSVDTVTWGGRTLTKIDEAKVGSGYSNLAWMGYLAEADIAAASGNTIAVTWAGTTPDTSILYAAVTLENAHQTSPVAAFSKGTATSASTVQIASALSVQAGDMSVYVTDSGEQGRTHSPPSDYTEGTEEDSGGVGQVASNATKAITSAGSEQPTATWSGTNNRLAIVGAVIKVAP